MRRKDSRKIQIYEKKAKSFVSIFSQHLFKCSVVNTPGY